MIEFDFLPPDFHERRAERRGVHRYGILIGALVLAMAAWVCAHQAMLSRVGTDLADVQRQRNQTRIHRALLEQLLHEREELRVRDRLCASLEDAASLAVVLADLSRVVPTRVALTEIVWERTPEPASEDATGRPAGMAPVTTRPADGDRLPRLRLAGLAPDPTPISDCAAGIAGSRLVTDVATRVLPVRRFANRQGPGFEINCVVLPQTGGVK